MLYTQSEANRAIREESMQESLHILLVEDDPGMRRAVSRALDAFEETLKIHEESDGESVVKLLDSAEFDCIFLDYHLPGMDGLEVLRALREKGVRTPIIVMTARGDEELAVQMMKAGASDYVPKGHITADRLLASLRQALRVSAAEKRAAEMQQKYRIMFEHSAYGVMIVDPQDQSIVEVNSAVLRALGYSREELSTKRIWELETERKRDEIQAHMARDTQRDCHDALVELHLASMRQPGAQWA